MNSLFSPDVFRFPSVIGLLCLADLCPSGSGFRENRSVRIGWLHPPFFAGIVKLTFAWGDPFHYLDSR